VRAPDERARRGAMHVSGSRQRASSVPREDHRLCQVREQQPLTMWREVNQTSFLLTTMQPWMGEESGAPISRCSADSDDYSH
jgi:hypothetical protein